jgi:hypothetical protein
VPALVERQTVTLGTQGTADHIPTMGRQSASVHEDERRMAAIAAGPVEVVEPDSPEQGTSGYWRGEVNIDEARRRTPASPNLSSSEFTLDEYGEAACGPSSSPWSCWPCHRPGDTASNSNVSYPFSQTFSKAAA